MTLKKDKQYENNEDKEKNIILFVGLVSLGVTKTLQQFKERTGNQYRLAVIHDSKPSNDKEQEAWNFFDIQIVANFNSHKSLTQHLQPYQEEFLAVTCRAEFHIPRFQKIIPHVPYLRTPTSQSLEWATHKVQMRKRFLEYDKKITPSFMVVKDAKKKTIEKIEEEVGFPLVIKPAGLAQSLLVNIGYHKEELEKVLKRVFRKIEKVHKETKGRGEPEVLVEQFIEGDMYSVDAFVNTRGKIYFAPMVHVKTGRSVGFDDFFAYQTTTPTILNKQNVKEAHETGAKAIHALGLRSTTAHVELLKTERGWKIIEVGPRVGGFRHTMYELSYGIDTTLNDIYIHIPKQPVLPRSIRGYTAVFKFFAKQEGIITRLAGVQKAQRLKSFYSINVHNKVGDRAIFAKHGGKSVFNITLFNKERSKLLADIRRLEQMVKIETEKPGSKEKSEGARRKKKIPLKPQKQTQKSKKKKASKLSSKKKGTSSSV